MLKYVVSFLALVGVLGFVGYSNADATIEARKKEALEKVVLVKKNTLSFRDVVTESSVTNLQKAALKMSSQLTHGDTIYLFLDTPGGSIVAGERLIATLRGLPQKVKTITNFAASMGFITVQSLDERLVLPSGILMSHRAYVGIEGQLPGEFNSQSKFWSEAIATIEARMAVRMGMEVGAYQSMIKDEYWAKGSNAVAQKAADKVVDVSCGSDLNGTYNEQVMTFFGPITLVWSECPLVTFPVDIVFDALDGYYDSDNTARQTDISKLKSVFRETYANKRLILNDPIHKANFFKYVR